MKTHILYLIILGLLLHMTAIAQSTNQNYIYTKTYTEPRTNSSTNILDYMESVQYSDGLGRPIQHLAKGLSPEKKDLITPIEYDVYGRQVKEYLPYVDQYANSALSFRSDYSVFKHTAVYGTDGYVPYSQTYLDASPLNRPLKKGFPGIDWQVNLNSDTDHTVKIDYQTNSYSDKVRLFKVIFPSGNATEPQLISPGDGLYDVNQLYKTITKDENWQPNQQYSSNHTVEVYKNKRGQDILKRTFNQGKWHDTYYVYDVYGNLTYVLPPKMATYIDFWQTEASSDQYYFSPSDFYQPGYETSQYNYGSIYFDTTSRSLKGYAYASAYSGGNLNVSFKTGVPVLTLPFEVDLSGLQIDVNVFYRDSQGNSQTIFASASIIENNQLVLNQGFPNYIDGSYFNMNFSASLDDVNLDLPDLVSSDLDALAYQYKYDSRNRLIEKKIPGKGAGNDWEEIVYNKLNQPILTRDPNLKTKGKWLFYKYDSYGRTVYTGILNSVSTRESLQTAADTFEKQLETKNSYPISISGTSIYYSNDTYPKNDIEVLAINYYDDYNFNMLGLSPETYPFYKTEGLTTQFTSQTKTLPTGSLVKVLGTNKWIISLTKYDKKARPIYIHTKNEYLDSEEIIHIKLDFIGQNLETTTTHTKTNAPTIVIIDKFTYDHAQRPLKHTQTINNQPEELISFNKYDELGRLVEKKVGGSDANQNNYDFASALQTINYDYNIRGWLNSINDPYNMEDDGDLFSFGLNYNNPEGPSTNYNKPLFNGNISHSYWKTSNVDSGIKHYSFEYDALNRFTKAFFAQGNNYNSKFNEYIYNYDRNGNIGRLMRYGQNPSNTEGSYPMDNITYTYDEGNKLLSANDSYGTNTLSNSMGGFKDGNTIGNDYTYDVNGNMVSDANKKITNIEYNHLNLPTKIEFETDPAEAGVNNIKYVYDANGVKQMKIFTHYKNSGSSKSSNKTHYDNGIIYEDNKTYTNYGGLWMGNSAIMLQLKFMQQPEGYIEYSWQNGYNYTYQYRDHLGNIRLSYKDKNKDGVIENGITTIWEDNFESASGWDGSGASWGWPISGFDTNFSRTGDYSGYLEPSANPGERVSHSNEWVEIDHSKGSEVIFSGWVYVENDSWNHAEFFLMMKAPGETGYATEWVNTNSAYTKEKWVYLSKKVTVPSHISHINFRIDNDGPGKVWYDDLSIAQINPDDVIEIVEEKNYYPFGLEHKGYNNVVNGTHYPYGYNGKEENDELDLEWLDFGARNYDASLGRWLNLDPLAETMSEWSPYNYAFNNPLMYTDPLGLAPDSIHVDDKGTVIAEYDDGDDGVYVHDEGTTESDVAQQRENTSNTGGTGDYIGDLGGAINIDGIYNNLLSQNMDEADGMWSPFSFRDKVKNGGDWDLKNNTNTIYGLGNDGETQFSFNGELLESQDIGNHHFGAVGKAFGLFSETFMLRQAGEAQMSAGTSQPEWQVYKTVTMPGMDSKPERTQRIMQAPYGDDPRDQQYIRAGFKYHDNNY